MATATVAEMEEEVAVLRRELVAANERLDRVFAQKRAVCGEHMLERGKRQLHEHDLKEAAGDLPIPVPDPGSPMAKLLRANRMLRNTVNGLTEGLHYIANTCGECSIPAVKAPKDAEHGWCNEDNCTAQATVCEVFAKCEMMGFVTT